MIDRPDPDTLSIRIPIRGRAALIRNTLIGAVLGAAAVTEMSSWQIGQPLITTLLGGTVIGGFAAVTAWLGQVTAQHPEARAHINRAAVLNAGLIGGGLGIIGAAIVVITRNSQFFSGEGALGVALLNVTVGLVFGGMFGAAITAALAIFLMIQAKVSGTANMAGTVSAAPHLLGERQFDPLQQSEEVPDHARR